MRSSTSRAAHAGTSHATFFNSKRVSAGREAPTEGAGRRKPRAWAEKFRRIFAKRDSSPFDRHLDDQWHLYDVVVSVACRKHWLCREVDHEGFVLDGLVQSRSDGKAAVRLMRKLLKRQDHAPHVLFTKKLRSSRAAKREIAQPQAA